MGWRLWVFPGLLAEREQLWGLSLPQAPPWTELECGQHLREARRCPVPLAVPTRDLPLWDPRLTGSSEHSITPGSCSDRPPSTSTPPQPPACCPPAHARGRIPPKLPRLPTRDDAWGWDQPPFSPLCSTPTSAQSRLGNQPANDARCGADGGPDAILPSSGLSMQMDV